MEPGGGLRSRTGKKNPCRLFPTRFFLDVVAKSWHNRHMKTCIRCGKKKGLAEFYGKKKHAGGKNYIASFCKVCDVNRIGARIRHMRLQLIEVGGGVCNACGYSKCKQSLEFHHRDKTMKDFHISSIRSITETVLAEIAKCDLLCANCHREAHFFNSHNI